MSKVGARTRMALMMLMTMGRRMTMLAVMLKIRKKARARTRTSTGRRRKRSRQTTRSKRLVKTTIDLPNKTEDINGITNEKESESLQTPLGPQITQPGLGL